MKHKSDKEVDDPQVSSSGSVEPSEDFAPPEPRAENEHVQSLREQNRKLTDQLLRMQADLENARKRMAREKEDFQQYSLGQTLQALLPVLDGFELAMAAEGGGEDYRRGIEIIYLQFLGTLQRLGLEPVETKGKPFDPNVHEAVAAVETTSVPEGHVVDEVQRGFFFKKRLLRPAKVRVAQRPGNEQ